jgi:hypothetical protein
MYSVIRSRTIFSRQLMAIVAMALASAAPGATAAQPVLTPPPRHLNWTGARLPLPESCTALAVTAEEQQIARVLREEMFRLHGVRVSIGANESPEVKIVLALVGTPVGKSWLGKISGRELWEAKHNDEGYLLDVREKQVVLLADTSRGLLYAVQTLLQLVQLTAGRREIEGAQIVDYPQLSFRGVHICIFPETELEAVRQAILLAARFKYNAVVIEPWASLKYKQHPETAYEHTYTPDQLRPLIELGRALHMDMIPMLNSWGHATGMRGASSEHVVLDRFPQWKSLYEPDGWSFCLANPKIYDQLFDRYGELLQLFNHPKYFHVGMDEAWGHRGLMESEECRGPDPLKTVTNHLDKIHQYFAQRNMKVIMWHDMFIRRDDPQLGRVSPANSVPPFNTYLALPALPKDVIIAAWNYSETKEWPVPKYFHDKGFPVVVCPWKTKKNTVSLLNTAKDLNLLGVLATTWDSLDVALPTIAQAGVLAWTEPGSDLQELPYDQWLLAIRQLPICGLPRLESTMLARDR